MKSGEYTLATSDLLKTGQTTKHLAADGPYQVSGKVTVAVVRCLVAGDGQEKAARAFCYEYRDECAGGLEMLVRGRGTGAGRGS